MKATTCDEHPDLTAERLQQLVDELLPQLPRLEPPDAIVAMGRVEFGGVTKRGVLCADGRFFESDAAPDVAFFEIEEPIRPRRTDLQIDPERDR